MSISAPFILRPIATSLLMISIMLAGILGYRLLPVSALPEVDYPTIRVATFYPGASPDVMTTLITAPLERQFGQMPGLNQMTSSSSGGSSLITLQFGLNLSLDIAEQEVQAAINSANNFLPKDLPNSPVYSKVNPADAPVMTLALTSKTMPLTQVEDLAETRFAQKLSQISGVGLVSISGGQRPAVRIQANPTALAAYGLSFEDIKTAINAANTNQPKGTLDGHHITSALNSNDQILVSKDYGPLIITYKNNAPVRIQDVATVIEGAENTHQAAWMNTEPAIILNIQQQPGANVIEVVNRIKELIPTLKASLPTSVDVKVLNDRTLTIRTSIEDAQIDLAVSVGLVVLVIFLFLRNLPATFIASLAIPIALVGSCGVMYLFGFSLNNLTIMALTVAAGFVVDDAIVMIENISRHIEEGQSPQEAALKGAKQIGFTILSLTISLIAVLIPLLFMADVIGRLFREFALTLSITILISAFVALSLTPMLCSRFLIIEGGQIGNGFTRYSTMAIDWLIVKYRSTLTWALNHQPLILGVTLLTIVINSALFYGIPKGLFPLQDTGVILGISEASQSISFEAMEKHQQALAKTVLEDPAVENLTSFIGVDGTNITLNSGRLQIILKPLAQRNESALEIMHRLKDKVTTVPGIKLYMQPLQDLSIDDRLSRTQYQYSVSSPDSTEMSKWTKLLVKKLQEIPQLQDVTSDEQDSGLQTVLTVDRDVAARLGVTMSTIDTILYDAFGQRQVSTMFTQRNQYYVVLETLPELRKMPHALDMIYVPTTNNLNVPLKSLLTVSQKSGPLVNNRESQFPVSTISFNLAEGASLGDAVTAINQAKAEIGTPESVLTSFEGAARIFQSSIANEMWLVIAAIVTVYIILGVLYESYLHPLTILSTLPSAGIGALSALWMCRYDLSIVALIGIILLIGIVMKNAIMMIDFALELERVHGKSPHEAIFEACLLRFRPILMTTMAALLGAVPLALSGGFGAELRQPLGISIIGGLTLSQLLTLYTVPVIYLGFDKLEKLLLGAVGQSALNAKVRAT